jgi:hypothetical protein
MQGTGPSPSQMHELEDLRAKSLSLEQQMAKLMKSLDGNSNYRNDIIWLAGEINRVQKQIKELESNNSQSGT